MREGRGKCWGWTAFLLPYCCSGCFWSPCWTIHSAVTHTTDSDGYPLFEWLSSNLMLWRSENDYSTPWGFAVPFTCALFLSSQPCLLSQMSHSTILHSSLCCIFLTWNQEVQKRVMAAPTVLSLPTGIPPAELHKLVAVHAITSSIFLWLKLLCCHRAPLVPRPGIIQAG